MGLFDEIEFKYRNHSTRHLLLELLTMATDNASALADLQASVTALQDAAANVPTDVSAGIESAVSAVDAVTTTLGGTPPTSSTTTPPATVPDPSQPAPATAPATEATPPS